MYVLAKRAIAEPKNSEESPNTLLQKKDKKIAANRR